MGLCNTLWMILAVKRTLNKNCASVERKNKKITSTVILISKGSKTI
jgi:hypothetical protein